MTGNNALLNRPDRLLVGTGVCIDSRLNMPRMFIAAEDEMTDIPSTLMMATWLVIEERLLGSSVHKTFGWLLAAVLLPGCPGVLAGDDVRARVIARIFERTVDYPATPSSVEIDTLDVGEDFVVKVLVEDVRPDPEGVFAGYLDVNFSEARLASLVATLPGVTLPGSSTPTPYLHNEAIFGSSPQPASSDGLIDTNSDGTPDQIDVAGSFSSSFSGSGAGEVLLFEFAMTAEAAGWFNVSAESTTEDPALDPEDEGESPLFDFLIFGQNPAVCPSQLSCAGQVEFIGDSIRLGIFYDGFEAGQLDI